MTRTKIRQVPADKNAMPTLEARESFTQRLSRKVIQGFSSVLGSGRAQGLSAARRPPTLVAMNDSPQVRTQVIQQESGSDPRNFTHDVPVKQHGDTHFFQGASKFKIKDAQFIAAGRDVNINTNDRSLAMIAYAEGSGIDTTKACLDGTRTEILEEIKDWVTTTTDTTTTTPRLVWLSGPAGTGKSAIAHTIARWWIEETNGIGSCFCFNRQATTRHEKLFTTIARDLAARVPGLRNELIKLIANDPALATTSDVTQQWRKLVEAPLTRLARDIRGPVVIVIDALDESGDAFSRRHILSILVKDAVNLPANVRILVTSRLLPDITRAFRGASVVQPKSMDQISRPSTERDIQLYISHQLRDFDDEIDDETVTCLMQKSDGLFEWARLACEYIKYADDFLTELERFQKLVVNTGEGEVLLDNTYMIILQSIMGEHPKKHDLDRFCSVLRLVLSTREPLPMEALDVLHSNMGKEYDPYGVATVLQRLGSLLSGTANPSVPVRALHSTFYEFLTTHERSGLFFVDLVDVHQDLGHACLQVMQQYLCFNICQLKSSYLHNSEVADLGDCIKCHIKLHLSYSCHFWADHIKLAPYQENLAEQISAILLNEKILFWLEVLGLLNLMNSATTMLGDVANWLQGHNHTDAVAAARDCIKFCRMFGGMISESTPHLYLSGLPFVPKSSILSQYLAPKFLRIPRIASGKAVEWSYLQLSITGQSGWVFSVAFSPDGKTIASASEDKTVYIWDAETGMQVGIPLKGHTGLVKSIAFSPDGKRLVSGTSDDIVYIWDVETGLQVGRPLRGHSQSVSSVAFSPDGKKIASGSWDCTVCIWDAEKGVKLGSALRGHTTFVDSVAFSPDGKRIASASDDKTICIWDAETGFQVGNALKGHTSGVNSVAYSSDGKKIASGSDDKTVCIWDAETGVQVCSALEGHTGQVNSIAFSPDGKRIASASEDQTVCIWDAETGVQLGSLKGHTHRINSVTFSPDGKRIGTGSIDKSVCIWDSETRIEVGCPLEWHTRSITSVAFSPDGKRIASGSSDKTVCVWDSETGLQVGGALKGHTRSVNSIAFSPDGRKIVSGSDDKTLCIWDAETGMKTLDTPLIGHTDWVSSVAFSPDGKRIVSGSYDQTLCIWVVDTGLQVGNPLKAHTHAVTSVAFSPDGRRIVSGSDDKTVIIWDAETGVQVGNPLERHTNRVNSVAFSPDGKRIVSGSWDNTLGIWDAKTGMQVDFHIRSHRGHVNSVAFSPDGKRIVSGSSDLTVCIWDGKTGLRIGSPFKGHTQSVTSVAFSPDGRSIVSGSHDKIMCIWDAETGVQLDNPQTGQPGRSTSIITDMNIKCGPPLAPANIIKFSSATEHALHDPSQLFEDTSEFEQDWKSHISLNDHGWITGPQGRLLMWLPPAYRKPLLSPKMQVTIPQPVIELDLSMMAHGYNWDKCYKG